MISVKLIFSQSITTIEDDKFVEQYKFLDHESDSEVTREIVGDELVVVSFDMQQGVPVSWNTSKIKLE